jgi:hypothetical protein
MSRAIAARGKVLMIGAPDAQLAAARVAVRRVYKLFA